MDILKLFDNLTDDEIQESTGAINEEIQQLVSTGKFQEFFLEQEIVYFNTQGFDINLSTIYVTDLEHFETLTPEEQSVFPKIAYSVVLNTEEPDPNDLENYSPFTMYIEPHELFELSDEKENAFLEGFKLAVLEIIGVILTELYKKLELGKDSNE